KFRKLSGNANDGIDNDNNGTIDDPGEDTGLPAATFTDLQADPALQNRIYAAAPGQGVFCSTNGGLTWNPGNTGLTDFARTVRIKLAGSAAAVPGTNDHPVYAGLIVPVQDTLVEDAAVGTAEIKVSQATPFEVGDQIDIGEGAGKRTRTIRSILRG